MGELPSSDPRSWFDEEELDVCPACGEKAVPRSDARVAVCLACESVRIEDDGPRAVA
jgi:hypothetical protein